MDFGSAVVFARMLQMGTRGTAIVQDERGQEVFRVG